MWTILVVVALLGGPELSAPIGNPFPTEAACAEHFSAHGIRVGLAAKAAVRKLSEGRTIAAITIACRRIP